MKPVPVCWSAVWALGEIGSRHKRDKLTRGHGRVDDRGDESRDDDDGVEPETQNNNHEARDITNTPLSSPQWSFTVLQPTDPHYNSVL